VNSALDNVEVNKYITARVKVLTRSREPYAETDPHYYALTAGIFELLSLQLYLDKQQTYENQNLSHCA
jgi:hypothetical protein